MRRAFGYIFLGGLLTVGFLIANLTLWGGEYIDSICVEGRLSAEQGALLAGTEWSKCPGYRQRQTGLGPTEACVVEERDRVVAHECSDFMRSISGRDNKAWKAFKTPIQRFLFGENGPYSDEGPTILSDEEKV